jgi:hypothetical protein
MAGIYRPKKNEIHAYHTDGTDEWYGFAPAGAATTSSQWQIVKLEYTGDNWIEKWPSGDDSPKYQWSGVTGYTYELLRAK